ncbi:MAG: hypothetical protein IPG96_12620 [Proteobacteria bacterium]|nr:hypothetical protein [Pseudomonadota bacterium]
MQGGWRRHSCGTTDPLLLEQQRDYYRDTFTMVERSGLRGSFGWFFKGRRPVERSDFGIVEDNATLDPRPVGATIAAAAPRMKALGSRTVDAWISVDRDAFPADWELYATGRADYQRALDAGQTPGVRTPCSGTDSSALISDDGVAPKCLNGFFEQLELQDAAGDFVPLYAGARIGVRRGQPIWARATARNSAEGLWRGPAASGAKGTVRLGGNENLGLGFRIELGGDVPWLGRAQVAATRISDGIVEATP